jgi:hypothetical protein
VIRILFERLLELARRALEVGRRLQEVRQTDIGLDFNVSGFVASPFA